MKKNDPKRNPFEEKMDTGVIERPGIVSEKSKIKQPKPKREGCISSLAGNKATPLPIHVHGEKAFAKAVLAGNASTFLAGKTTTSLAGGALTSLAGFPGTSLLILTKEEIPKGTVIKKTDLEAYVVSKTVTDLDESISREIPVGRVAEDAIPAHRLIAAVGLFGNSSIPVSEIKLIPGNTLVIRTKKPIRKGTVIQEEDLEVSVISSPIKSPDMYVSKEDLVGKVAKESVEKDKIVKKSMVK